MQQNAPVREKYILRYTNDLSIAAVGDDFEELVWWGSHGYKTHITTPEGGVLWQSSASERYGSVGVRAKRA